MEGNGVISNRDFLPMGIEGRRGRGRHRISGGDPLGAGGSAGIPAGEGITFPHRCGEGRIGFPQRHRDETGRHRAAVSAEKHGNRLDAGSQCGEIQGGGGIFFSVHRDEKDIPVASTAGVRTHRKMSGSALQPIRPF